jgi:hypothetical protein
LKGFPLKYLNGPCLVEEGGNNHSSYFPLEVLEVEFPNVEEFLKVNRLTLRAIGVEPTNPNMSPRPLRLAQCANPPNIPLHRRFQAMNVDGQDAGPSRHMSPPIRANRRNIFSRMTFIAIMFMLCQIIQAEPHINKQISAIGIMSDSNEEKLMEKANEQIADSSTVNANANAHPELGRRDLLAALLGAFKNIPPNDVENFHGYSHQCQFPLVFHPCNVAPVGLVVHPQLGQSSNASAFQPMNVAMGQQPQPRQYNPERPGLDEDEPIEIVTVRRSLKDAPHEVERRRRINNSNDRNYNKLAKYEELTEDEDEEEYRNMPSTSSSKGRPTWKGGKSGTRDARSPMRKPAPSAQLLNILGRAAYQLRNLASTLRNEGHIAIAIMANQ